MCVHARAYVCVCVSIIVCAVMIIMIFIPAASQSSEASAEGYNIRHPERGSPPHTQAQLNQGLSPSAPDSN